MISEEQPEQGALYALGLLDADEAAEFERALAADTDLRALVADLYEAAASVALAAGEETVTPPAGLKTRLLAEVERKGLVVVAGGKVGRSGWTTWIPWTIAAAACVLLFFSGQERDHWYKAWGNEKGRAIRALAALNATAPLKQVAFCQLEPTPDGPPQPRVAVVWDPAHRQGELIVVQLKPPAVGHDYQLWAVEEGRKDAVSAGLVYVDTEGRAKVEFSPAEGSEKVQAFALSVEQAGGSEKNKGPIILLGKL